MSNLKTMLLVTVPYTPTENSFRMIPATKDCPYVDVVYWKDKKVLEITSIIKRSEYAMFAKLDDNGDAEPRKSAKTLEDGQKITHKQERRIAEVNTKYYIINKDEIDAFVAQVAINSDTVDYKQYLNDTNLVKGNAPMEIIKP
jgi:archaellum component FlaF (FlaF/FlaG flagellin family)